MDESSGESNAIKVSWWNKREDKQSCELAQERTLSLLDGKYKIQM